MTHPNADLVRKGFDAFATGDIATLDQLLADDVKWHVSGRSPLAGDFEGKEAVFGSFAQTRQEADSLEQDIHAIVADDEHAVALVNGTFTRGGKTYKGQQPVVFHVREGKATEAWVISTDQYGFDEFWAG